ncbi:helix-turn-helix transcriptional regulator [Streptomyces calidiresistens]|uniref:Helix-turn-helix domain-containing protein n=1 Tax=Streptomyces calidiresistens TaxID=1485586 RepID=A0A7W3XX50_9ACTN|nr:helix-turn-helix transcriptional regulator [Streptomyces calidiresistens]MBB0230543.1 helix-turn-helix domain-containing protein [Streptomyces calidiresistens]
MRAFVEFGEELRKRRLEAGLSLTGLSARVHYSKAHLSKVERGLKRPSGDLARLCDAALDAGGALIGPALRRDTPRRALREDVTGPNHRPPHTDEEAHHMNSSPGDDTGPRPIGRRRMMVGGAGAAMAMGVIRPAPADAAAPAAHPLPDPGTDEAPGGLLEGSRALFEHYRSVGQTVDPVFLIPALTAHTHSLREAAGAAGGADGRALLLLASRYAEYAGWLIQETGDDTGALARTRLAVELAETAGDRTLAGYALTRHALIAMYRGDASQTVELSRRAGHPRLPARVRGLAAQHEAQGHALAGDHTACMRSLDRARDLLAEDGDPGAPVLGTTHLPDIVGMVTGWCLVDLGRPGEAARVLDRQVAHVPARALRVRTRFGVRRALAHAMAGEIDHAARLTGELLDDIEAVNSATVTTDVRRLARVLTRHERRSSVRRVAPRLGHLTEIRHS